MDAELQTEFSISVGERAVAEVVIWNVPRPLRGSLHLYKYRMVLVVDDVAVLRYDNEAGKGDHRHVGRRELPYDFRGPEDLLVDFWGGRRQMAKTARKVTISVVPNGDAKAFSLALFRAGEEAAAQHLPFPGAHIAFISHELLWKVLTMKRLALLQAMAAQEPMSIREAARRAGRDVKAVHGDVQTLLRNGLLKKTDDARIVFPYDEIHLDVVLRPLEASAA